MNDTTHQVVILDNLSSPYIKQAIIVLKNYDPTVQSKIIRDAESIVAQYMDKLPYQNSLSLNSCDFTAKPKKHLFLRWLAASMLILLLVGAVVFRRII